MEDWILKVVIIELICISISSRKLETMRLTVMKTASDKSDVPKTLRTVFDWEKEKVA
jgi:hypothetical protein